MNKTQLIIPKDVQNHVNGRIARRVLKAAALLAAEIFVFVWYAQDFWSSIRYWTVLVYAAILVATYFMSGLHAVIRDKTWCGVIEDVKVKTTIAVRGNVSKRSIATVGRYNFGDQGRCTINTVYATVRREDGTIVECVAFEGNADDTGDGSAMSFYLKNFRPGDRIIHIRGAKYYQIDPDEDRTAINCVVCGDNNPKENEKCHACGHTLRLIKKDTSLWF